jgi:hypothetical protein
MAQQPLPRWHDFAPKKAGYMYSTNKANKHGRGDFTQPHMSTLRDS